MTVLLANSWLFDTSGFPARWTCGNWTPALGWLHIVSDLLIWAAYLAIPLVLIFFVRRRRDVPFPRLFWLFGAFILTCGTTHLIEAVIFYHPIYRLAGVVKMGTALVSWATVIALVPVIPRALALRTPGQLEREVVARTADLARANAELRAEAAERRRAEQALHEERERFRLILASIGDGVLATDPVGRVTFLNEVASALTGWSVKDALGSPLTAVFPLFNEADEEPVESPAAQALREGTAVALANSTMLIARNGVRRPVEHCGAPIRGGGAVAGAVVVFRDVTERRRAAEAHARLAAIVESSEDAIVGKDLDGIITNWNRSAERLLGYTESEVLGRPISVLVPPELHDEIPAILGQIRRGETVRTFETQRLRKDGTRVDVSLSVSPVKDARGRIVGAAKIARDITDRKRAEELLLLRDRAIQAVEQGILITDPCLPDNPSIYASPGFERLTGHPADEVVGRNCRFLQGPQTDPGTVAQLRDAIAQGRPCSVEVLNYKKDGTPFWNALTISPVRDDQGRLTHFVGVQANVTERRRLEEQYRQSQKMEVVGLLAGGVAHDFNNLLCIIIGYGELLLDQVPARDPAREMIGEVVRAAERGAGLTRQLLAFSRKAVLVPEVLDLNAVVGELEKMLRRTIGEDICLAVTLRPDLGRVKADPGQVEQVLMNLAVNARDAMPAGGKLTIETDNAELDEGYAATHREIRPGSYVLVAVSDTGHGMTADVQARIFEPFFTTKGPGKGTGLGLATVYGIVKQSGGSIEVYSEPEVGTSFKVYLPRVGETAATKKSAGRLASVPRGAETVLLVEDDAAVRSLARRVLEQSGYLVLEADNGLQAVRVAEGHAGPIHLLVSDVIMPELGGPATAGRLLAARPQLKVLFLSGYTDDAIVRHGILAEQVNFLQKPFTTTSLAQKVRDVLGQP